jgi:SSS family solute:Na+ symporter
MATSTTITTTIMTTISEAAAQANNMLIDDNIDQSGGEGMQDMHLGRNWGLHVSTFLAWTIAVAVITTIIVSKYMKSSADAADDFFLGGRSLTWYIVAGSLMLTNLSTEQLVGLNGVIVADGCMAGVAWETFAALAMCVTSIVFVPTYARSGFSTTSGFLGERFDRLSRTLVSMIFLVYYAFVTCPMVLYTGGLAIQTIFELESVPRWIITTLIGVLGSIYALSGGLKAVAVSDCLNGVGLIIFGLWVPFAALSEIGGISYLFQEGNVEHLKPFATNSDIWSNDDQQREYGRVSLPWSTLFTGLMMINLYYWSTNQLIVQRVLGAQSLAHGQKGVMFAATMKVIGFTFLCLPGVIGLLMAKNGVLVDGKPFEVPKNDQVYPLVVKAVMPTWSLGLFAAVLLGSVLSTYNSALQSASTLFGLEVFAIYIEPGADAARQKKVATLFGIGLSLFSYALAPQLASFESIFDYLQKINAMTALPIVTLFCVGLATRLPDAFAAKCGFAVGVVTYGACQFVEGKPGWPHYLHLFAICFVIAVSTIMAATYISPLRKLFCQSPKPVPFEQKKGGNVVDITPWKGLYPYCGVVTALVALISIALQIGSQVLFYIFWIAWMCALMTLIFVLRAETSGGMGKEVACSAEDIEESEPQNSSDSSSESSE